MYFSTKGLVIRETAVGEADKSVLILAEGHGKISAWAKGAKRIKSPLLHGTTLFTYASFTFFQNKERISVNEAVVLENFFPLRTDMEKLALASYLVSLAGDSTPRNQEEDALLRLTLNALYALTLPSADLAKIKAAYELRSMMTIGYLPELLECVCCGNAAPLYFFSASSGGLACEACNARLGQPKREPLSPAVLDALRYIADCQDKRLYSFQLGSEGQRQLSNICQDYILSVLGYKPPTLDFYEKL